MGERPPLFVEAVLISPRIAYLLETRASLTDLRVSERMGDQLLRKTLESIRYAAMAYAASLEGSDLRQPTEATTGLNQADRHYTPEAIATLLKVTPHRVRQLIREGEIDAAKTAGRWHIDHAALTAYRARRDH